MAFVVSFEHFMTFRRTVGRVYRLPGTGAGRQGVMRGECTDCREQGQAVRG